MKALFASLFCRARSYKVFGPQGGIDIKCTLPKGFDTATDRCPMVILMHGFMASRRMPPISTLCKVLANAGIATISFDFNAHGRSEGKFIDMTIGTELTDARAVYEYVCNLPYVGDIALLGHSQGGVIAGMLAGELEESERRPKCLVQLAPAAVLKDDALAGQCMGSRYDAQNPPEYVSVMFHKLGRKFILEAQKLDIYESSCRYGGDVCIIHGNKDGIVPTEYSQEYHSKYAASQLHIIDGENHFFTNKKSVWSEKIVTFLKGQLF